MGKVINDFETVNTLVNGNIRLAYYLAQKWTGPFENDDAVSIALCAMLEAARSFDPEKASFSHHASTLITYAFQEARRYKRRGSRGGDRPIISLDAEYQDGLTAMGAIPDPSSLPAYVQCELRDRDRALMDLLMTLPRRDQEILKLRFGLGSHETPASLDAISRALGISRERVRQVEFESLNLLARRSGIRRKGTVGNASWCRKKTKPPKWEPKYERPPDPYWNEENAAAASPVSITLALRQDVA